eukprot:440474_1
MSAINANSNSDPDQCSYLPDSSLDKIIDLYIDHKLIESIMQAMEDADVTFKKTDDTYNIAIFNNFASQITVEHQLETIKHQKDHCILKQKLLQVYHQQWPLLGGKWRNRNIIEIEQKELKDADSGTKYSQKYNLMYGLSDPSDSTHGTIKFKILIYPKGYQFEKSNNSINFVILLRVAGCDSFVAHFHLKELQTQTEYRITKEFDGKTSNTKQQYVCWPANILSVKECEDKSKLIFQYNILILQVSISSRTYYYPSIAFDELHKKIKFNWNVINYPLTHALHSFIYSPPNKLFLGLLTTYKNKIMLVLQVIKMPSEVTAMDLSLNINVKIAKYDFNLRKCQVVDYKKDHISFKLKQKKTNYILSLGCMKTFKILFTVEIKKLWFRNCFLPYTMNNVTITEWREDAANDLKEKIGVELKNLKKKEQNLSKLLKEAQNDYEIMK